MNNVITLLLVKVRVNKVIKVKIISISYEVCNRKGRKERKEEKKRKREERVFYTQNSTFTVLFGS